VTQNRTGRTIGAVGVILPVHDEAELLPGALQALEPAVDALSTSISSRVAIVLDDCGDDSSSIARCWAAEFGGLVLHQRCRNVGLARRTGSVALLAGWPEKDPAQIWLATTDADSRVPEDWLAAQLEAYSSGVDLWAGRVSIDEESATIRRWTRHYATERSPIHGANLGVSAAVYLQLGGFRGLPSGEDRDLLSRAAGEGFQIGHDFRAVVTTSSRRHGRAPRGFAGVLEAAEREELEASA